MYLSLLLVATLSAPLAQPAGADPDLVIDEREEFYEIHAATRSQLKTALRKALRGEGGHDGEEARTRQTLTSRYELAPTDAGCRLKDMQVHLETTVRLPRWISPEEDPPTKLQASWNQLYAGLTEHEQGHRELAIDAARQLVERLRALGERETCQELDRDARKALLSVTLQHSIRDNAYERRTRNGAAQGVKL